MKRGLGRGLNSLFGEYEEEDKSEKKQAEVKVERIIVNEPKEVEIGLIDRNPDQPRKIFDEEALAELSTSIKNYGVIQPIIVKEVGSGLNDKRPKLEKLLEHVMDGKVNNIYVTYKDRLTRFGYHYLEKICEHYGVRIIVVKDIERRKSIEQELAEDLMSLIASFSGKLYGLRSKGNSNLGKEL